MCRKVMPDAHDRGGHPGTLGGGHLSAEMSYMMPMIMVWTLEHVVVGAFKCRKVMPDAHDKVGTLEHVVG